jgi:GDPmannose 4,6-dehydratase
MNMADKKKALITGITGQDGAYLADFLLKKNYIVYGAYRRTSTSNFWRIEELGIKEHENLRLIQFDLTDGMSAVNLIENIAPDEVYNLAAQSFVATSFEQPSTTLQINAIGTLNLLEAIKKINKNIKFYQASTSEMFGKVQEMPQNESTPFYPRSPYGISKLYAHWTTVNYRESYDIFASSGILFNHESPLRGLDFVTRKITSSIAKIIHGKLGYIELGNLDAKRDWGYAEDYVEGMWLMLQNKNPDSFILATGKTTTIRDFCKMAFKYAGIEIDFKGSMDNEVGFDVKNGNVLIKINPLFYRPAEVNILIGDPSKAQTILGWQVKTNLEKLCELMIQKDLQRESFNH